MGNHKEWRKLAKKARRKRIRQEIAAKRVQEEEIERRKREASPSYLKRCAEEEAKEIIKQQEEARLAEDQNLKWLKTEEEAQKKWKELQITLAEIEKEKTEEEERLLKEWKKQQEQILQEKERLKKLKEENKKKAELVKTKIDEFISNEGELPDELNVSIETNPNRPLCPFFEKTGACRFKDSCSRNHVRPGISNVLLIPSFYSHISLQQPAESEYGSDVGLEYDDHETYDHFKDFYNDVLPELGKCGPVIQFKVCRNKEPHLRGNVYVEYKHTSDALKAFKMFNGRWYGGKQINVEFCNISSWKAAICGLSYGNKCPKGSCCNYLHVFVNPGKAFYAADKDLHRNYPSNNRNSAYDSRNWRWSETPERKINNKENHKSALSSHYNSVPKGHRKEKKRRSRSKSRSRSRSSKRHKRRHKRSK